MNSGNARPSLAHFDRLAIESPTIDRLAITIMPGRNLIAAPANTREPFVDREKRMHAVRLASSHPLAIRRRAHALWSSVLRFFPEQGGQRLSRPRVVG